MRLAVKGGEAAARHPLTKIIVTKPSERGEEEKFVKLGAGDADDHHGLEAATPLKDEVTDPDGALDGQGACRCVSSGCPASYLF